MCIVGSHMQHLHLENCAGGHLFRTRSGPASMHLILEVLAHRTRQLALLGMKTA